MTRRRLVRTPPPVSGPVHRVLVALAPILLLLLVSSSLASCGDGEGRSFASKAGERRDAQAGRVAWRGRLLSAPLDRPSFTLRDTEGGEFAFRDRTAGRLTLLFFGYTHCPDVCPSHLGQIAEAIEALDAARGDARERVQMVFVGVDPERDTGPRVREWLDHFDPSFVGLVGDADELAAAQKAAFIAPATRDEGGTDDSYTVSHASYILLYTPDDRAHLRYAFDTRSDDWVHDLGRLLERGFRS